MRASASAWFSMSTGRISIARAISASGVRSGSGGVLVVAFVGAVDIVGQSYVATAKTPADERLRAARA